MIVDLVLESLATNPDEWEDIAFPPGGIIMHKSGITIFNDYYIEIPITGSRFENHKINLGLVDRLKVGRAVKRFVEHKNWPGPNADEKVRELLWGKKS